MCGICGAAGIESPDLARALVRRMRDALAHRGPDDQGELLHPRVALGMRRLSIIDVAGGAQPVWNEDRTVAVVLNGEVYNFAALRRELESHGHRFRTRADTEVVVHAWEQWGADCVHHLRGMFAFALAELPNSPHAAPRLLLARDRLGIKPLYYACVGGLLLWASEVRALLASGLVEPRLSRAALESYLLFGSVGEPMTLIEGVFSLPPGHRALLTLTPGAQPELRPEPYWGSGNLRAPAAHPAGRGALRDELRALLEESVRLHLVADVPVGVFLSSGLDSTAIAALAARARSELQTCTVVFPEQEFSEAAPARRTAARLGAKHLELSLSGEEMLARLDESVAALDQPSMDGTNSYFVSWAARQAGWKVALSGLGGDELFGGYDTFRTAPRLARLGAVARRLPAPLRAATAPALAGLARWQGRANGAHKLAAAWRAPGAFPHPYFYARALFTPEQAATLAGGPPDGWRARAAESPAWEWLEQAVRESDGWEEFARTSWLEMRSYLVSTLLRDTDAMSMAHSLEVRVPFLDHALVEFTAALPEAAKRGARPKALLVETLADIYPPDILAQRKRTFTLPWERWLRGALRERVADGLAHPAPALAEALDARAVQAVWQDFLSARTSWTRPWSLYVLNQWAARHLRPAERAAATAHGETR